MRNTPIKLNPAVLAALALGATALMGTQALAAGLGDTCEQATDCDEGLACEVVGATGCACASPTPTDPGEGGAPFVPPECDCPEPVEFKACVPGPCQTDADCGAGLVCATWEEPCASTRPAVPCSSEEPNCGAPMPEEECTPTTYSVCAPRWILPCEGANDCGAGFACEAVEQCSCTGNSGTPVDPAPSEGGGSDSGSSGSGDREGAPYYEEPECTCTPSEENWCRPVEVSCTSDADCSDGWACADAGGYDDVPCAMPEPDPSGDGFAPPPNPDCGAPREETETVGLCQPLGWGGWYGGDRGEATNDESTNTPTLPTPGTGPAPAPADAESAQGGTEGTRAAGGGCAGGELPAWFALAGLALVARRRLTRSGHAG
jgi:hypothetical protein